MLTRWSPSFQVSISKSTPSSIWSQRISMGKIRKRINKVVAVTILTLEETVGIAFLICLQEDLHNQHHSRTSSSSKIWVVWIWWEEDSRMLHKCNNLQTTTHYYNWETSSENRQATPRACSKCPSQCQHPKWISSTQIWWAWEVLHKISSKLECQCKVVRWAACPTISIVGIPINSRQVSLKWATTKCRRRTTWTCLARAPLILMWLVNRSLVVKVMVKCQSSWSKKRRKQTQTRKVTSWAWWVWMLRNSIWVSNKVTTKIWAGVVRQVPTHLIILEDHLIIRNLL